MMEIVANYYDSDSMELVVYIDGLHKVEIVFDDEQISELLEKIRIIRKGIDDEKKERKAWEKKEIES